MIRGAFVVRRAVREIHSRLGSCLLMASFNHFPRWNRTSVVTIVVSNGVVSVGIMARVRAVCGLCFSREVICPICYPDIRSVQALHRELPVGWYAHCEACHYRLIDG